MKARSGLGQSSGQGRSKRGAGGKYKSAPPGSAPVGASRHGSWHDQENAGLVLPSIDRRTRPGSVAEGMGGSRRAMQSMSLAATAGANRRRGWPSDYKPEWVGKPSDEKKDLMKLENRFREMSAMESTKLERQLTRFTKEHQNLIGRSSQMSPLVVCVLDEYASTGGLLKCHAGSEVSFALQVKYSFAGHLGEGGDDLRRWVETAGGFQCILQGPATVHADVVYQGSGTYVFFYKPTVAGKYQVSVRLGKGDVPGSPFESIVHPGKTHTEHCGVSGLGLLCAEAGVEANFQITSRDQHGNVLNHGGDRYDVSLTGPVCFNANVVDMDNGVYQVKYNTIMCGDYYISIRREGVALSGSPYVLSVVAGKTHGPSSTAVGEGLKTAFAGHEAEFIIEARDIIGNQRVVGDDAFHVEVEGPSTPQISVFDRDDGTYLVSYVVGETGTYHIRVSLHGSQIAGSPFSPTVMPGRVLAVRCTGVGRGLTRSYAGEDAKFVIESRDVHRNKTTSGCKPFVVSVRGAVTPQVHCIKGDNGEYHYSYRTAKAGVYFVGVLFDGVDIGGSPFKLTVDPGPTHANGCSASGPGITGSYTMVETSFVIQARDYFGNARTTGGDVFNIEIGGTASARMRVRDNENGTYTVAYTPEIGGDYFISVMINGVNIQDSPFTVSSDPMPRESYLEMYRSLEPTFGKQIQDAMLGLPDNGKAKAADKAREKKQAKIAPVWDLSIKLLNGKNLVAKDTVAGGTYGTTFTQSSDPYVVFKVGESEAKSATIEKNLNPEWNEELVVQVKNRMERLEIEVFDMDISDDDDSMGKASISLVDLVEGKPKMITAKLKAYDESGKESEEDMGDITMVLTFKTGAGQFDARALR